MAHPEALIHAPMPLFKAAAFSLTLLGAAAAQAAGDAKAGKEYFAVTCKVCHSAEPGDDGGGQGPSLAGLIGRTAGKGDPKFGYTKPIRASGIVWDAKTLDTFLTNPGEMISGTAMAEIVASKADRDNLIAYFQSLK